MPGPPARRSGSWIFSGGEAKREPGTTGFERRLICHVRGVVCRASWEGEWLESLGNAILPWVLYHVAKVLLLSGQSNVGVHCRR